jgi:hypothetical protein
VRRRGRAPGQAATILVPAQATWAGVISNGGKHVILMRKHARRVCAAAAAGLAFSALGPGMAADAATPGAIPGSVVGGRLYNVAAASGSDAWAVGQTYNSAGNCGPRCNTITLHYNGCMWARVPSPNPPSIYLNVLWGVAIISRDDVWAVGSTDYNNTLIPHWNGTSWS